MRRSVNDLRSTAGITISQPIDDRLRRIVGVVGAATIVAAVALIATVRPGLFGLADVAVWLFAGAGLAIGAFLAAVSAYGVERVVTVDPKSATIGEEIRTIWGLGTGFARLCEEYGPLSVLREDGPDGRSHFHLFTTDDDGSVLEIADLTDEADVDRLVTTMAPLRFGAATV